MKEFTVAETEEKQKGCCGNVSTIYITKITVIGGVSSMNFAKYDLVLRQQMYIKFHNKSKLLCSIPM